MSRRAPSDCGFFRRVERRHGFGRGTGIKKVLLGRAVIAHRAQPRTPSTPRRALPQPGRSGPFPPRSASAAVGALVLEAPVDPQAVACTPNGPAAIAPCAAEEPRPPLLTEEEAAGARRAVAYEPRRRHEGGRPTPPSRRPATRRRAAARRLAERRWSVAPLGGARQSGDCLRLFGGRFRPAPRASPNARDARRPCWRLASSPQGWPAGPDSGAGRAAYAAGAASARRRNCSHSRRGRDLSPVFLEELESGHGIRS
jgi:hypothetical protein